MVLFYRKLIIIIRIHWYKNILNFFYNTKIKSILKLNMNNYIFCHVVGLCSLDKNNFITILEILGFGRHAALLKEWGEFRNFCSDKIFFLCILKEYTFFLGK